MPSCAYKASRVGEIMAKPGHLRPAARIKQAVQAEIMAKPGHLRPAARIKQAVHAEIMAKPQHDGRLIMTNKITEGYDWKGEVLDAVIRRKTQLEALINNKETAVQKAPEGSLRVADRKNTINTI